MRSAVLTHPVSASVFLLGDGQDSSHTLIDALDKQVGGPLGSALQDLAQSGRAAVSGEFAAAVEGLLDLDLGDLPAAGWCKHNGVRAAARRTMAAPGSAEVVALATHRITSTHAPSVDLLVNGVRVATVHLELRIQFILEGLIVTVRRGCLVALRSGSCDAAATLAVEGQRIATRRRELRLPLVVRLGDGVPLLHGTQQP